MCRISLRRRSSLAGLLPFLAPYAPRIALSVLLSVGIRLLEALQTLARQHPHLERVLEGSRRRCAGGGEPVGGL